MSGKTEAQLRMQIIADIEAIRLGVLSKDVGSVIFQGYKELSNSVNREIAVAKLCMATEGKAHEFGKVVKFGRRVIDEPESDDGKKAQQ